MPNTPTPSRDATVTAPGCLNCQHPIPTGRGRLYCGPRCRQAGYRRRHSPTVEPPPLPTRRSRRDTTVYACPDCDTHTLGEQRCPDCNTFTHRLGPGGHCPHCDETLTLDELLGGNPDSAAALDNT